MTRPITTPYKASEAPETRPLGELAGVVVRHCLAQDEGTSRLHIATYLGETPERIGRALQWLRRKGYAENGHGYMGYSWYSTPAGDAAFPGTVEELWK